MHFLLPVHVFVIRAYQFLFEQGLWRSVIGVCVGFLLAKLVTFRPLRRHRKTLEHIEHMLDTGKPGGLTDVVDAINRQNPPHSGKDHE
jgi:hypothetical protein